MTSHRNVNLNFVFLKLYISSMLALHDPSEQKLLENYA